MELIVVKAPGVAPVTRMVPKIKLPLMQKIVGGSIELQYLDTAAGELDLWLNEEGKLERQTPNLAMIHEGRIVDVIVGTVFVCGSDGEGDSIGLTQEQAAAAIAKLNEITLSPEQIIRFAAVIADMF